MRSKPFTLVPLLVAFCVARSLAADAAPAATNAAVFDVRSYGAIADGKTLNTGAIQKAVDAAAATAGGGRVLVPAGTFLTGTIQLKSHVDLHLDPGAKLLGSGVLADYPAFHYQPTPASQPAAGAPPAKLKPQRFNALVYALDADHVSITGTGTIDGNGKDERFPHTDGAPGRPRLVFFGDCRDSVVQNVTLRDACSWVQHYLGCRGLRITGIHVYSHANLNNDGLDIDSSDVTVTNCEIDCDDDGICLKSDREQPCENVVVRNCTVGSNCNAIKMGTRSTGGFKNISIKNCTVRAASEHRMRKWKATISGIALELVDGGAMDQVEVSDVTMTDVQTPIFIRLGDRATPPIGRTDTPAPGTLRNLKISNIKASAYSTLTSSITGIPGQCAQDITISHVRVECPGGMSGKEAEAAAAKPVPENEKGYPENRMFGKSLPAHALYVRHVRGLTLEDVQFTLAQPDARPALAFEDAAEVRLHDVAVDSPSSASAPAVRLAQCKDFVFDACKLRGAAKVFIQTDGAQTSGIQVTNSHVGSAKPVDPPVSAEAMKAK